MTHKSSVSKQDVINIVKCVMCSVNIDESCVLENVYSWSTQTKHKSVKTHCFKTTYIKQNKQENKETQKENKRWLSSAAGPVLGPGGLGPGPGTALVDVGSRWGPGDRVLRQPGGS